MFGFFYPFTFSIGLNGVFMTRERMHLSLIENRFPQAALAHLADVDCATVSRFLRNLAVISENEQDKLELTLMAMLELSDESSVPVDWRQAEKLRPIVTERVASYRAARSAELRRNSRKARPRHKVS